MYVNKNIEFNKSFCKFIENLKIQLEKYFSKNNFFDF